MLVCTYIKIIKRRKRSVSSYCQTAAKVMFFFVTVGVDAWLMRLFQFDRDENGLQTLVYLIFLLLL